MFRILGRNISDAFKSVFRNGSLSLASIVCITITLLLVGVSIIISYNVNSFADELEKELTIVVFVERDATDEEIVFIKSSMNQINNIENIDFKSKKEIKAEMQKKSDVFDSILSEYDDTNNPLQDTFLIKVEDNSKIGATADEIKKIAKVETVKYGEGMAENLVSIFDVVKRTTVIVVAGLVIVTAFLISNTIKVTIVNRKRQIEIMRLVGASNSYIKIPYFFEGLLLGLFGSIIPIFAVCYGYIYAYDKFGGKMFTNIITLVKPDALIFNIIYIILIIGVFVGAFGSYRAVRRYLKI
jgi:cell division transport system permease protein